MEGKHVHSHFTILTGPVDQISLSFHIFFVQSRYHNYFHSLIQDINTFQYTWHFLSKHFFILGRHCLDGFQLKNDAFEDIQETYFSKYSFSDPQHSVSAPAHSFVIAPNPATSPQNGISAPVYVWLHTVTNVDAVFIVLSI